MYLFKENYIIWGMDSPLQTSNLQIFDRKSKKLKKGCSFPGPVWYSKIFSDQSAILQTSVEIGDGVKSNYSSLFYSKDLINWSEIKDTVIRLTEYCYENGWSVRFWADGREFLTGCKKEEDFTISDGITQFSFRMLITRL
jgi:hypothetical protein